jgi:endonuclease/exonuclease/phosphatase family metal-dependent hydrolase
MMNTHNMVDIALLKYLVISLIILILLLWGVKEKTKTTSEIRQYNFPDHEESKISIMSFNIAYAGGLDNLKGSVHSSKEIHTNLDTICDIIKNKNITIATLQEIDIRSKRSHFIDQVEYIAKACKFPYAAVTINWDKIWVPYPTNFHISQHFGPVLAAQVIFSKFPLKNHHILTFNKPKNMSKIRQFFYINRHAQFITISLPDNTDIIVGNVHLEAFHKEERESQASSLRHYIATNFFEEPLILAGDFNSVHPKASNTGPFADEPTINYNNDSTLTVLQEIPHFKYLKDPHLSHDSNKNLFTFPSNHPNRQLDYIMYSDKHFERENIGIIPLSDPYPSDHRPIFAEFRKI